MTRVRRVFTLIYTPCSAQWHSGVLLLRGGNRIKQVAGAGRRRQSRRSICRSHDVCDKPCVLTWAFFVSIHLRKQPHALAGPFQGTDAGLHSYSMIDWRSLAFSNAILSHRRDSSMAGDVELASRARASSETGTILAANKFSWWRWWLESAWKFRENGRAAANFVLRCIQVFTVTAPFRVILAFRAARAWCRCSAPWATPSIFSASLHLTVLVRRVVTFAFTGRHVRW